MIGSIEEQGKLTDELKEKILAAETLVVVEDLYRPYRPKRKTRASVAREKGLEGLAEYILKQEADQPLEVEAAKYVYPEHHHGRGNAHQQRQRRKGSERL